MENLGYRQEFPVTTKIANKVFDLEWASRLIDDFSLGLHIFAIRWLCDEDVEVVKMMNTRADALHQGTAAPTLADVATGLDHDLEVHILQTIGQLRYGMEMSHTFWYVLLGPHHAVVREHRNYRRGLVEQEMELERAMPRDPRLRPLVPALLARRMQIDHNVWLQDQARINRLVPTLAYTDVFTEIKRKRDWAPDLPSAYFGIPAPVDHPSVTSAGSSLTRGSSFPTGNSVGTPNTKSTSGTGSLGQPPPSVEKQKIVVHQTPNAAYEMYKTMGITTKAVKERCKAKNVAWPQVAGNNFCPTFHVKGMCNTRCGNSADHREHTAAEDAPLLLWCGEYYKNE
jgi:hypothetical protein